MKRNKSLKKFLSLCLLLLFVAACCHGRDSALMSSGRTEDLQEQVVKIDVSITIAYPSVSVPDGGTMDTDESGFFGSGFVLDVKKDPKTLDGYRSLVMTAGHVCEIPKFSVGRQGFGETKSYSITVITSDDRTMGAEVLSMSRSPDVCLLSVRGRAGTPVAFAADLPHKQSLIQVMGCPAGFKGDEIFFSTDGRYLGVVSVPDLGGDMIATSLAGFPGLSGSPIFFQGKVIGMLVGVNSRFEHLSFGVDIEQLQERIELTELLWEAE